RPVGGALPGTAGRGGAAGPEKSAGHPLPPSGVPRCEQTTGDVTSGRGARRPPLVVGPRGASRCGCHLRLGRTGCAAQLKDRNPRFGSGVARMRKKRTFDLTLTILGAVVWVPVVLGAALVVLVCSGRPIFYRSMRRVSDEPPMRVVKFRTMVRNAAEIANRDTVPVDGS